MNFFLRLFKDDEDKNFEDITKQLELEMNSWDYGELCKQNLDRNRFSYSDLCRLGWWPDQMLIFIQINRIAYADLMHLFSKYSSSFDKPLRRFLKDLTDLSTRPENLNQWYQQYFSSPNPNIPDRYWDKVLLEDNCYMYQLEEESARRSRNEHQHYCLYQMVRLVLQEKIFSEPDPLLKVYICLYNLRGGQARIDDYFRRVLAWFLENPDFTADIKTILYDLPEELNYFIDLCSETNDRDVLSKLAVFRNLIGYAGFQVDLFSKVFHPKTKFKQDLKFQENLNKIVEYEYTYLYFQEQLENKDMRDQQLLENSSVDTILRFENDFPREHLQTPSFTVHGKGQLQLRNLQNQGHHTRRRSQSFGGKVRNHDK